MCLLVLGLTLFSPVWGEDSTPPAPGSVSHVVTESDSFDSLSALYGVNHEQLKTLNGVEELEVGQVLWISPSPQGWALHEVMSGQTLWRISKGYGIPLAQIRQANGLVGNDLMPGDVLVLPRLALPPWTSAKPVRRVSLSSRSGKPVRTSPKPLVDTQKEWIEVRLPDNRRAWVRSESLVLGSWKPQGRQDLVKTAREFVGVPYVWGGTNPNGYDCSGFVQEVFRLSGHKVPRLADVQYEELDKVPKAQLEPGDLVFFNTDGSGVSHVGIYTGDNKFLHASSSKGVVESGLDESYYATRFVGAARLSAWNL